MKYLILISAILLANTSAEAKNIYMCCYEYEYHCGGGYMKDDGTVCPTVGVGLGLNCLNFETDRPGDCSIAYKDSYRMDDYYKPFLKEEAKERLSNPASACWNECDDEPKLQ